MNETSKTLFYPYPKFYTGYMFLLPIKTQCRGYMNFILCLKKTHLNNNNELNAHCNVKWLNSKPLLVFTFSNHEQVTIFTLQMSLPSEIIEILSNNNERHNILSSCHCVLQEQLKQGSDIFQNFSLQFHVDANMEYNNASSSIYKQSSLPKNPTPFSPFSHIPSLCSNILRDIEKSSSKTNNTKHYSICCGACGFQLTQNYTSLYICQKPSALWTELSEATVCDGCMPFHNEIPFYCKKGWVTYDDLTIHVNVNDILKQPQLSLKVLTDDHISDYSFFKKTRLLNLTFIEYQPSNLSSDKASIFFNIPIQGAGPFSVLCNNCKASLGFILFHKPSYKDQSTSMLLSSCNHFNSTVLSTSSNITHEQKNSFQPMFDSDEVVFWNWAVTTKSMDDHNIISKKDLILNKNQFLHLESVFTTLLKHYSLELNIQRIVISCQNIHSFNLQDHIHHPILLSLFNNIVTGGYNYALYIRILVPSIKFWDLTKDNTLSLDEEENNEKQSIFNSNCKTGVHICYSIQPYIPNETIPSYTVTSLPPTLFIDFLTLLMKKAVPAPEFKTVLGHTQPTTTLVECPIHWWMCCLAD